MKIAVTDLKDYVEGILRFEWLDLEEYNTAEAIKEYISNFLSTRTKQTGVLHEEWFVTDYDEFPNFGEYPDLDELETAISLIQDFDWESVNAYHELFGNLEGFEDAYNGVYDSEEDFAYQLIQDCYSKQDLGVLEAYLDYERYARDLFMTDHTSEQTNQGVVVFRTT